ncbi:HNH endonuclease [Parasphingorhabdus sp.]|uniref:HNH endonuclease n=1 Tax=Parasphingorhabdus sp. TaxID=2709688 RepID=UPI003C7596FF
MAGVFVHRRDTHYTDRPDEQYQFPKSYLSRASMFNGDWAVYYEPVKAGGRGFYAVAFVEKIVPDPTTPDHFLALIEPGSYLDFGQNVPHRIDGELVESGLRKAKAAVRPLIPEDFVRIINLGLGEDQSVLPRIDVINDSAFTEERAPFLFEDEKERRKILTSRTARDANFRKAIVRTYDRRCAFTGLQFINGGGRAEVEAAHIKPVSAKGPDSVNNGLALCGTMHWMFDRGLLSLGDDLSIMVSRHVNDIGSIDRLLLPTRTAVAPDDPTMRPLPHFLEWHRENCFKS